MKIVDGRYYVVTRESLGELSHQDGLTSPEEAAKDYIEAMKNGDNAVILYAAEVEIDHVVLKEIEFLRQPKIRR